MSAFNFFDRIVYINLDRRKDRFDHCQEEFAKAGILEKAQRFSAISHEDGVKGSMMSHITSLREAYEAGTQNVLVLEDDVKFDFKALPKLELIVDQLSKLDWELFYLGCNPIGDLIPEGDNLYKITSAYSIHAFAYNRSVMKEIIDAYDNDKINVVFDKWIAEKINPRGKCYASNPMIAYQIDSYSDLEKKHVKYGFLKRAYFKKTFSFKKIFSIFK